MSRLNYFLLTILQLHFVFYAHTHLISSFICLTQSLNRSLKDSSGPYDLGGCLVVRVFDSQTKETKKIHPQPNLKPFLSKISYRYFLLNCINLNSSSNLSSLSNPYLLLNDMTPNSLSYPHLHLNDIHLTEFTV